MGWIWSGLIGLALLAWMKIVSGQPKLRSALALCGRLRWPLAWRATVESRERTYRETLDLCRADAYRQRVEAAQEARDFVGKFVRLTSHHEERDRAYVLRVELDGRLLYQVANQGLSRDWDYLRRRLVDHVERELAGMNYYAFRDAAERSAVLPYRRR